MMIMVEKERRKAERSGREKKKKNRKEINLNCLPLFQCFVLLG